METLNQSFVDPSLEAEMAEVAARVEAEHIAQQAAPVANTSGVYRSGQVEAVAREEARDLGTVGANGRAVGRTSVYDAMAMLELQRVEAKKKEEEEE